MSDLVWVACKLPHGLDIGGVKVLGNASHRGVMATGTSPLYSGYALTPNFPRDKWEAWLQFNACSPVVVNKLIFADASRAKVIEMTRSNNRTTTGQEPLSNG